jgi:hypothetical protein
VLENWWWIFVLLNLEKVTCGITIEKINNVILIFLLIIEVKNGRKLVSIEASGFVLVECRIRVSMQLKENFAPYLMVVHCCVHCTNLTIQTFYTQCNVWNICYNPSTPIMQEVPRALSCIQLSWTPKVIKLCEMLKLLEFLCCLYANGLWLNTRPSL